MTLSEYSTITRKWWRINPCFDGKASEIQRKDRWWHPQELTCSIQKKWLSSAEVRKWCRACSGIGCIIVQRTIISVIEIVRCILERPIDRKDHWSNCSCRRCWCRCCIYAWKESSYQRHFRENIVKDFLNTSDRTFTCLSCQHDSKNYSDNNHRTNHYSGRYSQ